MAMNNKVTLRLETPLMRTLIRDAKEAEAPVSWIIRRILRQWYAEQPIGAARKEVKL